MSKRRWAIGLLPVLFLGGCLIGCMTQGHGFWEIKTPMGDWSYTVDIGGDAPDESSSGDPFVISFTTQGWDVVDKWFGDDPDPVDASLGKDGDPAADTPPE